MSKKYPAQSKCYTKKDSKNEVKVNKTEGNICRESEGERFSSVPWEC